MSKTLFWYVFKSLFLVFLSASGAIAAIMSFGGLLRPLTENGLEVSQVGQMLAYAMPAMTTYSYPIAALFACTIVYGRLAADNEVTAIRAAGISLGPLGFGLPALALGLIVSVLSLAMLSFLVPAMTLRVERTIVSNIGQFVVNRIEQQHQVRLMQSGSQPLTIFAKSAAVEPVDPDNPNEQIVRMDGVSIVTYARSIDDKKLQVPEEFYIARQARAYIRQPTAEEDQDQPVLLRATLVDGMKFPRSVVGRTEGAIQGGVRTQQFGPFPLRSNLRENTKFMDIGKLRELLAHPERSRRMQELLESLMRSDQQREYLESLRSQFIDGTGMVRFKSAVNDHQWTLLPGPKPPTIERNRLLFPGDATAPEGVKLIQQRPNQASIETAGQQARLRVFPDPTENRISVAVEFPDAVVRIGTEQALPGATERNFIVEMPEPIQAISERTVDQYLNRPDLPRDQVNAVYRNLLKQNNSVESEMHSRASFAISCLVLTMVGYGLGVMFKSGNYLNAFAVSVVPAIVSIVLIVTGQHICENVPPDIIVEKFKNPKELGLVVIWTGNAIVLALAVILMVRLRRT